jgi:hypothetical protein
MTVLGAGVVGRRRRYDMLAAETANRWRRSLLPAALALIISGDVSGDNRIRAGGVAIVGAAILVAVAGSTLRRPARRFDQLPAAGAARFNRYNSASSVARSSERELLIVRPDQAQLYDRPVRAFGAARVLYDRRHGERRQGMSAATIERRRSERRQRAEVDFDVKAFGSAWIRLCSTSRPRRRPSQPVRDSRETAIQDTTSAESDPAPT